MVLPDRKIITRPASLCSTRHPARCHALLSFWTPRPGITGERLVRSIVWNGKTISIQVCRLYWSKTCATYPVRLTTQRYLSPLRGPCETTSRPRRFQGQSEDQPRTFRNPRTPDLYRTGYRSIVKEGEQRLSFPRAKAVGSYDPVASTTRVSTNEVFRTPRQLQTAQGASVPPYKPCPVNHQSLW